MWQCTVNPVVKQRVMKFLIKCFVRLLQPGARWEPHPSPAQPVGGPGSVHGGGPGRISGRAAPHHAGRCPAQAAQQWQLLWGCASIQTGATDGPSQHGEEGGTGRRDEWRRGGGGLMRMDYCIMNGPLAQSFTVENWITPSPLLKVRKYLVSCF